jgi:hypothetical protein
MRVVLIFILNFLLQLHIISDFRFFGILNVTRFFWDADNFGPVFLCLQSLILI